MKIGIYNKRSILSSLLTVISFISVIPIPSRLLPKWTPDNLRHFPVMLPVAGLVFGAFWLILWQVLSSLPAVSPILRGFMMMLLTLALTGGLHLDGLMDTCDAIFSHRDRDTRLKILSDTHTGSFAVICCVVVLMAKTLLFSELLTHGVHPLTLSFIPVYSRLGLALLLTNLPFAKPSGLAATLGASRSTRDNIPLVMILLALSFLSTGIITAMMILCLVLHVIICVKIFGGITGDLLGAFVEVSEVIMLSGMVIVSCI